MPCDCGLNVAKCEVCKKGWEDDLRNFGGNVEWEGKDESWVEAVVASLVQNDIKVRSRSTPVASLFSVVAVASVRLWTIWAGSSLSRFGGTQAFRWESNCSQR